MTKQVVDIGSIALNGADGDTAREAFTKVNDNFTEVYDGLEGQSQSVSNKVDKVVGKSLVDDIEIAKLLTVEANATQNSSDNYLLDRVNHTGTQAINSVSGLQAELDGKEEKLVQGVGITIDRTNPDAPVISAAGGAGLGDVVGPSSSIDGEIVVFSGTTGKVIGGGVGVLGTAAFTQSSEYATAEQGGKADTAVQPGTLGTAAFTNSDQYATAAELDSVSDLLVAADAAKGSGLLPYDPLLSYPVGSIGEALKTSDISFREDLANSTDNSKGASLIGYNSLNLRDFLDSVPSQLDVETSVNLGVDKSIKATTPNSLYEKSTVIPSEPSGQIANELEVVYPYGGALYCLFKGSYSGLDKSYLSIIRPNGDGLREIFRLDLGVGDDARAMTVYEEHIYIFVTGRILVYRLIDSLLQLKFVFNRTTTGFIQSCRVIGGRLIAPNWGAGTVEVYDLVQGVPCAPKTYAVGGTGNASIVSWGNIHYLIRHFETANLIKIDITPDGTIFSRGVHTIPNVVLPRYAVVENGVMTVGGYSTTAAKTVALDIGGSAPIKIGEFINMPTHVKVGKYLIGNVSENPSIYYNKTVRVDMETGSVELLSETSILYPVKHGETVFAGLQGTIPQGGSASPADSPRGQAIAVYTTAQALPCVFPKDLGASARNVGGLITFTTVRSLALGESLAKYLQLLPAAVNNVDVQLRYTLVNNQSAPTGVKTSTVAYSFQMLSNGTVSYTLPRTILNTAGSLASDLQLVTSSNGVISVELMGTALTNAQIHLEIRWSSLNSERGVFVTF